MSITIKELTDTVAREAGITKVSAEKVVESMFGQISSNLKQGNEVVVRNFGRFHIHTRPARKGRNPKTGEAINIPSKAVIKFSPRGDMK